MVPFGRVRHPLRRLRFLGNCYGILFQQKDHEMDGLNFITPQNLFIHLECWMGEARRKKMRNGYWIIWHARNNNVFNNTDREVDELVEEVKVLSLIWSLQQFKTSPCLCYEWCWTLRIVCGGRHPNEFCGYGLLGFRYNRAFFPVL